MRSAYQSLVPIIYAWCKNTSIKDQVIILISDNQI